ncbi:coilin-like isoform X2 [Lycium ferocissimum]|uniref:coilin-like isoform X2 n=1 Tax=Lycium ferocissimum TaxID=112874 RepID=UPI00281508F9|nr:coilin-like isoform X2 [Lycium ferocissimum]
MERVRVRLIFKDPNILSDSQKSEGLRRSWFLLKPQQQHKTISDVSSHILTTFQLHHSCPHGLLLSMDGFLLPPFESTCILKDKCIVSVKKKGDVLAIEGNDAPNIAENNRIVEKQPVNTGQLPLANKEFDNESGGYESEDESEDEEGSGLENSLGCNVISRKRKSETLPSSEKKKHCSDVAEKVDEQTKKSQQDLTSKKSLCKQKKVANPDSKDVDNNKGTAESSKVDASISGLKKNNEFQEKDVENVEATTKPERVKKCSGVDSFCQGPSRSARKQYAKRQRLREMLKFYENVAAESEGLKEMQANAGRRAGNLHSKWHVNGETDGRAKGRGNWRQQQSKTKNQEVIGQPKGLLHWKQSREEDKGGNTNRQEQANEKSTMCEKPDQALQQDQVQEIDFSSVLEVRLVKNGTSDSVAGLSGQPSEGPVTNGTSDSVAGLSGQPSKGPASNESNPVLSTSEKKTDGPTTVNLWEQLSETIKANTEQSYEESSWGKWNPAKSSWSHRALTGSACGPTMALRGRGRGPTMARGRGRGPTMAFRGRGRGPTMAFRGRGRGYNGR